MTLAKCKENFIALLDEPDNHVIALSGRWGTGKSYLWREVQEASADEKVKDAVYVSLFGLARIADLKFKVVQGVLPKLKAGGALAETITKGYVGAKRVLKSFHAGFSAIDELELIAVPWLLKDRFIAIDDIERKHQNLSIDEILGFIDDSVQNHGCRILLILNSDQLEDKKLWELLREKVIDQELRLDTSLSEAFDIAARLTSTAYAAQIKPAVEACHITNIRIVRKIIRVVNRLLADRGQLPSDVLTRVIPSATLLSAIYYKGLEDGPTFDFVLDSQPFAQRMLAEERKKLGEEETPEDKARERWLLLLDKLEILGTDEFEILVVDYLKSGLIEGAAVGRIIARYLAEDRELATRTRAKKFWERSIWHPEVTETELLEELRGMLPDVGLLDMYTVTSLHDQAMSLEAGGDLGQKLVDGWMAAFRKRHPAGQEPDLDLNFNHFGRPLHPDIAAEMQAMLARKQSGATLLEVCRTVRDGHGWGRRERTFMQSVSPADYETTIIATTGSDLKLLLLQSMDFLKNTNLYGTDFGGSGQSFLEACRRIVAREQGSRIAKLIYNVFRDAGIETQLTPADDTSPTGAGSGG
ncbi:hypothetical protein SAMN02990966_07123 [Rhodospirillales bacterium URHD0017]|nr:hypothetical protein SAMN02990966_07123 [Rhodospirillales bacterium URHD0017]